MPRLPFLDHTRFLSRPTAREIADRSKRNGSGVSGASGDGELATGAAQTRYRIDDTIEWALSPRGRESIGLAVLAASSIALIYVLHHQ